jgi:uncharacterized membrane protein YphA (DoxX/SURF4 family)
MKKLSTIDTSMPKIKTTDKIKFHPSAWLIFLRIGLGVILIWTGINFLHGTFLIEGGASMLTRNEVVLALVASIVTLLAGLFITIGLFTRTAAFLQLPIVVVGIFYIHGGYIQLSGFETVLTAILPFLLLLFITEADDEFSEDHIFESD